MFLTSDNLSGITHGFFTRNGGVSEGMYASLNGGTGSGDVMEHVIENRARITAMLGHKDTPLLSVHQVHGCGVVTVAAPWRHGKKPQADAMVTATPGLALGILTADCAPVLLADTAHGVIGAAHAGWKGALAGVLERTVEAMCASGADTRTIAAAIGPAIGKRSYEVSEEFRGVFLQRNAASEGFFRPGRNAGHFFFDLRGYAQARLMLAGVHHINTLENDTYIEEDMFFSYRRATHRAEPGYGRQVSAIMLTPSA